MNGWQALTTIVVSLAGLTFFVMLINPDVFADIIRAWKQK